jgi:hypothetical protein
MDDCARRAVVLAVAAAAAVAATAVEGTERRSIFFRQMIRKEQTEKEKTQTRNNKSAADTGNGERKTQEFQGKGEYCRLQRRVDLKHRETADNGGDGNETNRPQKKWKDVGRAEGNVRVITAQHKRVLPVSEGETSLSRQKDGKNTCIPESEGNPSSEGLAENWTMCDTITDFSELFPSSVVAVVPIVGGISAR